MQLHSSAQATEDERTRRMEKRPVQVQAEVEVELMDEAEFQALEKALQEAESQHRLSKANLQLQSRRRLPSFSLNKCSTISRVTKAVLPKFLFGGRIVYSRTISEIENATNEILQILESKKSTAMERVSLGFDLEWKPYCFQSRENYNKVAVLQLCGDANRCDVMHIFHSGIPFILKSLLENKCFVKVGIGISGDKLKMLTDYSINVEDIEDLSSLANRKLGERTRRWSLSALCEKVTGKEVAKPRHIRCGNWEVGNLTVEQLKYAATDAYASWYLYEVLRSLANPP